ncbi:MAG: leucine-rich repeat protein [Candidatus Coproplasma sp.]
MAIIKNPITVAGSTAEPAKPEEAVTIELNLASGNQTVTPTTDGYVMTSVVIEKPLTLTPDNVKAGVVIAGVEGGYSGTTITSDLDNIIDGTISSFAMPSGKTSVYKYSFYQMTGLTVADLTGAKSIGDYAFYGCTSLSSLTLTDAVTTIGNYAFYNCTRLTGLTIPQTVTSIGDYAFQSASTSSGSTFTLSPATACKLGNYAFNSSKISAVSGHYGAVGSYAFTGCGSLTTVEMEECAGLGSYAFQNDTAITKLHINVKGSVGDYTFYGCTKVNDVSFSGNIKSLGSYAFSRFCSARSSPESNVIDLDLTDSAFSTINQYAFGGDSSTTSYRNQYMNIRLPTTVATINQYAFRYTDNCNFYFSSKKPPTLSATTSWSNATNYKIFVPFGSVVAYREATNWTAQVDYMCGFAPKGTFAVGSTLPELNSEGYELTWYSDKDCTEAVTEVTDENAEYYCKAGDEKVAYGIMGVNAMDCTISITDEEGNSYVAGGGVRTGTVLTITATPTTEGYVPYMFKVNGEAFESGSTITVDSDITVVAIYWDGENLPINPTFADNSWTIIREVFKAGTALQFWKNGDEKEFTSKSGLTYLARLVDAREGRYNYSDGSGTSKCVIQLVECYNLNGTTSFYMNSTNTNSGGYGGSYMNKTTLQNILADLPDDLVAIISEVDVLSGTGGGSTSGTQTTACKLFLPAEMEIFDAQHYSIGSAECPLGQFDYYKENNTNAARIKYTVGTTNARWWWLRSPYSGSSNSFCYVNSSGSYDWNYANSAFGVSPCFAI